MGEEVEGDSHGLCIHSADLISERSDPIATSWWSINIRSVYQDLTSDLGITELNRQ